MKSKTKKQKEREKQEELEMLKELYGEPGDEVSAGYLSDGSWFVGDYFNTFSSESSFYDEINMLKSMGYAVYDEWSGDLY